MDSLIKSLKELSYANILVNFSRHVYAYATTEDENLKRNLYFLQRTCSNSLLQFICKNPENFCEKGEKILDFLGNENLKELIINENLLRVCDPDTLLQKVIPIAYCLNSISVEESYFYYGILEDISKALFPHATNVVRINISIICSDEIIKIIAFSCTALQALDIHDSFVTREGIKSLFLNPGGNIRTTIQLQYLNVLHIELKTKDVACLVQNIPTLEVLKHSKLTSAIKYLYSSDKANKAEKFNLQALEFNPDESPSKLSDQLTTCREKCPKVKRIKISVSNKEHLLLLSLFSKLEILIIKTKEMFLDESFDLSLNSLLVCIGKGLRHMCVRDLSLSVSVLIENCPNLETLALVDICYQEFDKKSEGLLLQIRILKFQNVVFNNLNSVDSVMKLLYSCENLEKLMICECYFEETDIISKLLEFSCKSNLKNLHFEYSEVRISFLEQFILNCSSLKTLTLDFCACLYSEDISSLRETVEAANKKIEIIFTPGYDPYEDYSISCQDLDFGCYDDDD